MSMTVPPTNNFSKVNDSAQQQRQGALVKNEKNIRRLFDKSIEGLHGQETLIEGFENIMTAIKEHDDDDLVVASYGDLVMLRERKFPKWLPIFTPEYIELRNLAKAKWKMDPLWPFELIYEAIKNYTPKNKNTK